MKITKSNTSYYRFKEDITQHSRYCLSRKSRSFLSMLQSTWGQRVEILDKEIGIYRAQRGCDWSPMYDGHGNHCDDRPEPYPESRMRPLAKYVRAGRSNVVGIPVFYAPSDRDTAISESRPGRGDFVSVAVFSVKKPLRLVDCNKDDKYNYLSAAFKAKLTEDDLVKQAWHEINRAFARPLSNDACETHYVPTQVIAEYFRINGFDGFHHKSALGKGYNLVLFDTSAPDYVGAEVHEVVDVSYETIPGQ